MNSALRGGPSFLGQPGRRSGESRRGNNMGICRESRKGQVAVLFALASASEFAQFEWSVERGPGTASPAEIVPELA